MYIESKQALAEELELKRPAVLAVSGAHNSGKTTLLEKLLPVLRSRGLKVGIIKHDGHDFTPDVPGTDSFRLREAGAEGVAVYWPCSSGTAMILCCWKASNPAAGPRSKWCAGRSRMRRCRSSRWPWWATSRVQTLGWRISSRWPIGSLPRCRLCKEKIK